MYIYDNILLNSFQNEMFQAKAVEKTQTDILHSVTCFQKLYHVWDNMEKYGELGRSQMTI